ncbi:MAG: family 43 glycosylhydrolase [Eubacteriales bacterium]|nr:family 43 glycosylhydrolase [Eubacteriales bacterium]
MEEMRKNPVLPGLFADPDLYWEDGVWYLYPTTDGFPGWSGHEFFVFTSRDGKRFEKAARVLDVASEEVPWATGYAWAPCIAKRNGKYYFYFCAKDKNGVSCIGAASADSPTGPFTAQPEPLITMDLMAECGIGMCQTIDPSIYREGEDAYLLFGNGAAAVVKLTEDMLHIEKGTLRNIWGLEDFRESVIAFKKDGVYHFTWSCDDTGSENYHVNYGVADSLYGPVQYLYPVLEKRPEKGIFGTGHHSIAWIPAEERYVIAYHRFATPVEDYPEGKGWHRETCLGSVEFDENGRMKPVDPALP